MLTPLKQFICDTCGEIIKDVKDGWVEWISEYNETTKKHQNHSFRIVHHYSSSPFAKNKNEGCYQHADEMGRSDLHLRDFLNENYGMALILKFLDVGPYHQKSYNGPYVSDMREFVDFMRRLTIPYYEEARLFWNEALEDGYFDDANELWVYGSNNLKTLIKKYGE